MNQKRTNRAENNIQKVIKIKSEYTKLRVQFQEMAFNAKGRVTLEADQTG